MRRYDREKSDQMLQPFRELFDIIDNSVNMRKSFAVNIRDSKEAIIFDVMLPDVKKDEVEVHVHNNMLHVDIIRKEEQEQEIKEESHVWIKREYYTVNGRRSFQLDSNVCDLNAEIKAQWKEGILEISIKKIQKVEPVKVNIV